ncbi:DNA cytosine methyltransferase [Nonomuraea sp. NPDC049714]|uniref:DNA cytosine methyltransferase n=1 Tax=Nonomuraea sp. NPDC049714 TaxID=3364357 RepID=UPI0037B807F0
MTDLTAVSLFAGIGGFDLALQRAGVKVVAAVEIDPAARSVLARRFPDVTLFEDVREVTGDQLRAAGFVPERGILTGGFPCQDLSVAGRRRGMGEGTRSGLYWEIDRLLADLRPAWVVLENVPGLLSAVCPCPGTGQHDGCAEPHQLAGGSCPGGCMRAHGGAMGLVLGSLGDRGYGFAYRVLDAQYHGVPQQRRRVIIVGRAGADARGPVQVLLEPEGGAGNPTPGRASGQVVAALTANSVGGGGGPDDNAAQAGHLIATTVKARDAKGPDSDATSTLLPVRIAAAPPMAFNPQTGGDMRLGYGPTPTALTTTQATAVQIGWAVRQLTPLERERLQGFPDGWTAGQSDAARCRQTGNAVAVPVVEQVARHIVAVDKREQVAA